MIQSAHLNSRHFKVWKNTSKQAWRCGSTTQQTGVCLPMDVQCVVTRQEEELDLLS